AHRLGAWERSAPRRPPPRVCRIAGMMHGARQRFTASFDKPLVCPAGPGESFSLVHDCGWLARIWRVKRWSLSSPAPTISRAPQPPPLLASGSRVALSHKRRKKIRRGTDRFLTQEQTLYRRVKG